MFCFAEVRAVEERMFARASVLASEAGEGISAGVPLEGDMIVLSCAVVLFEESKTEVGLTLNLPNPLRHGC